MNKQKLSIIDIWNLKENDVIKSYKIKGMKKYENEYKSYVPFDNNAPIINIDGFRVERNFNTNIIENGRYLRLLKGEKGNENFQDIHLIFPIDTKVKCYIY
jgi:hypothetical protein